MGSLTVASQHVVSVGLARRLEAHRLPASIARNLPASVAAALACRTMAAEYDQHPPLGLDLVVMSIEGAVSRGDLSTALALAEQSLKPSGPADCLMATARLRAVASHRPVITSDEKLSLAIYGEKLARFPADAVALACERWLEQSPFWPAVSELLRLCEWACQPRRELVLALTLKMREAPDA
jgi:hypothetical protein